MANQNTRKRVCVYIGRFQPLHNGHVHVIENGFKNYDAVIILVGSAFKARDIKNPFTFEERKQIINSWIDNNSGGKCSLTLPLRDQPYNDAKWIQTVQESVDGAIKHFNQFEDYSNVEIVLTGSERDTSTWYLQCFPQWGKDFKDPVPVGEDLNATALRERLFTGTYMHWKDIPPETNTFLKQFIATPTHVTLREEFDFLKKYKSAWASAPYAPIFLTTDAVVIQSGHILVVERANKPGKGLWALPGGFLNQGERLLTGAIRELIEETGIRLAQGKRAKEITEAILRGSVKDKEIFDHPDRSLRGRTVTTVFLFRLDDTNPLPEVKGQNAPLHETNGVLIPETAKAFWLPIHEARANSQNWFEDHHAIIDTMIGLIKD